MSKKRRVTYVKQLKNNLAVIKEIEKDEALSYVRMYTGDPYTRLRTADSNNPVKCGVWLVWWFERH